MEVAFEPYKKMTFQSYLAYRNAEAYMNAIALVNPPGVPFQARLFWANGVLFRFFNHAPSEALSRETIAGHLILDHIEFAPMPEYKNELKVADRPLGIMNIIDVSNHIVFDPLTAWIRKNLIKE
jgi:hypothetical protein